MFRFMVIHSWFLFLFLLSSFMFRLFVVSFVSLFFFCVDFFVSFWGCGWRGEEGMVEDGEGGEKREEAKGDGES